MLAYLGSANDDGVSLSSTGSSGGPAPLPSHDEPPPLVAPTLVVANICTSLAAMTGAIMCWYFSAHTQVWGTGFFEGALNIGASMALLGVLVWRSLPNFGKVACALVIFVVCIFANILVLFRTSRNLTHDVEDKGQAVKDLVLKILGHSLTLLGATTSSLCLILLSIRGVKGAVRAHRNPEVECGSHSVSSSAKATPRKPHLYQRSHEAKPCQCQYTDEEAITMEERDALTIKIEPPSVAEDALLLDNSNIMTKLLEAETPSPVIMPASISAEPLADSTSDSVFISLKRMSSDCDGDDNNRQSQEAVGATAAGSEPSATMTTPLITSNHVIVADSSIVSGNDFVLTDWSNRTGTIIPPQAVGRFLRKQASTASCRSHQSSHLEEPL